MNKSLGTWKLLLRETVLGLPIFRVERCRYESPRTGGEHDFFVLHGGDWCNVVALTEDNQVVMVRQFRHGTGETTLEIPGGVIDLADASPLDAARRELREESGYAAETLEPIGVIRPNPAIQSNACYSFLARAARPVGEICPDEAEDIEVVLVPLREIPARIAHGEIAHALVVVAFAWFLGLRAPDGTAPPQL